MGRSSRSIGTREDGGEVKKFPDGSMGALVARRKGRQRESRSASREKRGGRSRGPSAAARFPSENPPLDAWQVA